jgi:fatty acid desaturase
MPATSVTVAANGVLLLDVADTRVTTRAPGIPRDIRQLVRDEHLTRTSAVSAMVHSATLVLLWMALSGLGLVVGRWWAWVPVWLAQIAIVRGAHSAMHDAAHGTLFRSKLANRTAGLCWSMPLLVNASLWRVWHLEHHRATVSVEDPEGEARTPNLTRYVLIPPVRSLARFASFQWRSLATCAGRPPTYARRSGAKLALRVDAALVVLLSVGLVAATVVAPLVVVTVWVVPVLGYWLLGAPFFDLPEHHRTATHGSTLDVSRTVGASAPLRWLVRNSNHHAAHHLVPTVGAGQLPRLDDALAGRTVHRSPSYMRHHLQMAASLLPSWLRRSRDRNRDQ